MTSLQKAICIGVVSALVAFTVAAVVLREDTIRKGADGSISFITACPGDDGMEPWFFAIGAYILTFTPALLLIDRRVRPDVFSKSEQRNARL